MSLEDYNVLNELLEDFRQEEAEVDIKIAYYIQCIKKADVILKKLKGSESDDYKVFSPRKMEVAYKDEIEQAYKEKSIYEEKNRELYRKKDLLSSRITKTMEILNRQDYNFSSLEESLAEIEEERLFQRNNVRRLNDVLKKVESGNKFLERGQTIQARQEFITVRKSLEELIDDIKNAIE